MTSYNFSHYKNLTGRSGVTNYYLGRNKVTVRFKDGSLYTYTNESAGPENIEQMKYLAKQGSGLNGYIVRHVYKNYSKKKRKNKR